MEEEAQRRFPEQETRPAAESPARRAATITRVGARYGFGFVFRRGFAPTRRTDLGRIGARLRRSFEELGPTYVELGRSLAARRDRLPPGVADELERPAPFVRPVPFEEVRGLIESELRNDLDRLFVAFEESPLRVGAFTQSHRATLPGERPALVVLRRPGVRRDLLALRPVADLVRRRFGENLPLDPSEAVADFASAVANRRDMYLAAQTSRRLRELEGFALKVPETYRSHSTSRCATFETPEGRRVPLDARERRKVSDELIRLSLLEGVFFADLAHERFLADENGDLWIADPTEVFSLDEERMRGLAEVFAAARREDVDGIVRTLPLASGLVPPDDLAFRRELREALGSLGGPLWREHAVRRMRDVGLEALRRGGGALQPDVARLFGSLVAAEEFGGVKERGQAQPSTVAAADASGDLVSRYRDPAYVAARAARKLARPEVYADYPRQLSSLLGELQDGEVEVRFRHGGLDQLISKVDVLANRLVFAVLVAALIVGSSLLGTFVRSGIQVLGVSIFGFVGFVVAAVLGLMLLFAIVRSGRI